MAEWEYAAAAGPKSPNGSKDAAFSQKVLAWYGSPTPARLNAVGTGEKNYWGIHDLHGLVWEWVADFNTVMASEGSRNDAGPDTDRFCGSGAMGAQDVANFPAFMRYSFRGSLQGNYCIHNLGFRCASNVPKIAPKAASRKPTRP